MNKNYDKITDMFKTRLNTHQRGGKMYNKLTEKDIEEMEKEIEHRKIVVRHQLLEDVKTARAQGDLSENFEYYAAKREKNINESRIRYLERMIRTAKVIEDTHGEDEAGIGKTVSIESPLGKSLIGHHVGDTIKVRVNDNYSYEAEIRKICTTGAADEAGISRY